MANPEWESYELTTRLIRDVGKAARVAAALVREQIWFLHTPACGAAKDYWKFEVKHEDRAVLEKVASVIGC